MRLQAYILAKTMETKKADKCKKIHDYFQKLVCSLILQN